MLIGRTRVVEVRTRGGITADDLRALNLAEDVRLLIKTTNSRLWGDSTFHDDYVGVTESAWNNPGKGKELALAQYGKGADVIFAAAGNSGLGVFDAAEQSDKFIIGVDSNQNWVKPGFVLTSMVKRVDNAVYQIIGDLVAHKFQGGIHVYGLEDGGIGYAMDQYNEKLIPKDVIAEVEAAKARIIRGEIKVTDAMAQ